MKNLAFIFFVLASVAGLPTDRILNGGIVDLGDIPYAASIAVTGSGHICGGFIYNAEWIVTSAACVRSYQANQLTVSVGTVTLTVQDPDQQNIAVINITINDAFVPATKAANLALLHLASAIQFSANVMPISIAEVNPTDNNAIIVGWGVTVLDGSVPSSKLRTAAVNLSADCSTANNFDSKTMICAGSTLSSPCQYDEGGPLVQAGVNGSVAIGVTSDIYLGCNPRLGPSIYTRLSAFLDWVEKETSGVTTTQSTTTLSTTTESTTPTTTPTTTTPTTTGTTEYTGFPTATCIDCVTSYVQSQRTGQYLQPPA